jgi:hypothetical protein
MNQYFLDMPDILILKLKNRLLSRMIQLKIILLTILLCLDIDFLSGQTSSIISNKNLIENLRQPFMLKSFKILDKFQCILKCTNNFVCMVAIVDSSICNIYTKIEIINSNTIYSISFQWHK